MSSETLLVTTADNCVIAINLEYNSETEKRRKALMFQQYCENILYSDFFNRYNNFVSSGISSNSLEKDFFIEVDGQNTDFLAQEIRYGNIKKSRKDYSNDLDKNVLPPSIENAPNTIHFDNVIPNSEVPLLIQNLGYKIVAKDDVYPVVYNEKKQKYEVKNFKLRRASVYTANKKIEFVRNHFSFSPEDYNTLKRLIIIANREVQRNLRRPLERVFPDPKERSLYSVYMEEKKNVMHRFLTLNHELVHIKNEVLSSGLNLKKSAKMLSVEDYYRLQVEDERSAYLSQTINAVNAYLKNGDPTDFSSFDNESMELVVEITSIPKDKRFEYVQNPENLIRCSFEHFEKYHRKDYDKGQFRKNMLIDMKKVPLSLKKDTDRKEFLLNRSLFYRFRLYNPQTKSFEEKNLSSYIKPEYEVKIDNNVRKEIIVPCSQKLSSRMAEYQAKVKSGDINPELVQKAKAMMRANMHKPQFIQKIDGFELSLLVDDKLTGDTVKPSQYPEQTTEKPAVWSKNLKKYWTQFDGYQKLTDNENEYMFSIKNSKVKYTAQNKVQLSNDAEYEMYVRLLNEPSNKNKPIVFKDTLTKEQALKLYVACVVYKRKMKGNLPKDFSTIKKLKDIPTADMQKTLDTVRQNNSINFQYMSQYRQNGGR